MPDSRAATNPPAPAVREVRPGVFEVGRVRLDQNARTLTFPATVNLREGMLEYVVVADHGKIHESLLRTDVPPLHLQVAMLLLGGEPSVRPPDGPERTWRVEIEVAWQDGKKTRRRPVGEFVRDRRGRSTLGRGRWFYVGSRLREDGFAAQQDGSIVALIEDPDALIGSAWKGRDDDDNWTGVGGKLPAVDTAVEVTLKWPERPVKPGPGRAAN